MRKFTLFLVFVLLGIGQTVYGITYTTTGNNSWSPSTPGNNINSSDNFVINHKAKLYGVSLTNGGNITINSGGELEFKWSASLQSGSSIYVASGGKLTVKQVTLTNYSNDFVIDGSIITKNGTLVNYAGGKISFNEGGSWELNQFSLMNLGEIILNEDAEWKNGSVGFNSGTVEINKELSIKNLSLSNTANIIGYGQVEVQNGNGTFSSSGTINGCTGQSCIPPSTIGNTTYLAANMGSGSTFEPYTGGALPSSSCTKTVQAVEDMVIGSDMEFGDLIVSPGITVTVEEDVSLTVCRAIANEGLVLIENNASLVQNTVTDENSGEGVYQIARTGSPNSSAYNSWSSPFQEAQIAKMFLYSNPCDVYAFDGASQSWLYDYPDGYSTTCNGNGVVFNSPYLIPGADGVMDVGRGYFVPGSGTTNRVIEGQVNNGDLTIDVHETSLGNNPNWNLDDWNLVGNPYPCALDLDKFYAENSGVVAGSFYFWVDDEKNGTDYHQSDDYAVFANNVGTDANGGTATRYVASAQAFWVYALTDAPIKFTNEMRVTGNNTDLFKTEEAGEEVFVYVDITNDSLNFNQCAVGFNKTSTNGFDLDSDAKKGEAGTGITISSLIDGNPYTIQAFEEIGVDESYAVPLQVSTTNAGQHTISSSRFQNLGANISVTLLDKELNQSINLKANGYTVQLDTGIYSSRFELIFEKTGSTVGTEELITQSELKVFNQGDYLIASLEGDAQLESLIVFDLLGKELKRSTNIRNSIYQMSTEGLATGVYLVKVNTLDGREMTTKVAVAK